MKEFEEIRNIIKTLYITLQNMRKGLISLENIRVIKSVISDINKMLYCTEKLKFQKEYNFEDENEYLEYMCEIEEILQLWELSLNRRVGNKIDMEFWKMYEYFKYVSEEVICEVVIGKFMSLPEAQLIECLSLPERYPFLQNQIDIVKGDFSLIKQHISMMCRKVEQYKWLYMHLEDYRSKSILNGIIEYWLEFDVNKLQQLGENVFSHYFYDMDIMKCNENDVLVNAGAFVDASIWDYITLYGRYKKIYAYEIVPDAYQVLVNNMSDYNDIFSVNKGISDASGILYVNGEAIEVVALDNDITEPVSVIKIDMRGNEKAAIIGATEHIKNDRPKLLVTAYYLPENIFDIPELLHDICDDYKFYIRCSTQKEIWPCKYVLIAV